MDGPRSLTDKVPTIASIEFEPYLNLYGAQQRFDLEGSSCWFCRIPAKPTGTQSFLPVLGGSGFDDSKGSVAALDELGSDFCFGTFF